MLHTLHSFVSISLNINNNHLSVFYPFASLHHEILPISMLQLITPHNSNFIFPLQALHPQSILNQTNSFLMKLAESIFDKSEEKKKNNQQKKAISKKKSTIAEIDNLYRITHTLIKILSPYWIAHFCQPVYAEECTWCYKNISMFISVFFFPCTIPTNSSKWFMQMTGKKNDAILFKLLWKAFYNFANSMAFYRLFDP